MTESARTRRMERCGNCDAEVSSTADVCPRCGALLAAYRNPLDAADELVLRVTPIGASVDPVMPEPPRSAPASSPPAEPVKIAMPAVLPPPVLPASLNESELHDARERLVQTLAALERELLGALPAHALPHPASEPAAPPVARTEPIAIPVTKPTPRRIVLERPPEPVFAPEPRKPGFMVKGSVPAVLLWGLALILTSCVVFLIASAAAGSRYATVAGVVGLLLGVVGAICVVFAMLVHLVRREAER